MTDNPQPGAAEPQPQVRTMSEMVAYQEGAVVSRTLIKKTAGTVTLFAFDEGQALSEHTTPYDALVQIVDGRAEVTIAGTPHALSTGDMLIMPGNVPHGVRAPERFKMVLTMIRSA